MDVVTRADIAGLATVPTEQLTRLADSHRPRLGWCPVCTSFFQVTIRFPCYTYESVKAELAKR